MRVVVLGSGVAVHTGRAESCIYVEDGTHDVRLLVDVGSGAFMRMEETGIHVNDIDAILLTHNHLDHNADVLTILKARWLEGGGELKIYGPLGTLNFFESLLEAFPYLRNKLKFKIFEIGESGESEEFKIGSIEIKSIPTIHSIESRAYLIDGKLLISGDTRCFKELMEVDCDTIIHEMSLSFGYEAIDHTTPENMAEFIGSARAERIYLTHMYPFALKEADKITELLSEKFRGEIEICQDMMEIPL
jgi:ribonuclease BN (tRNA processing enzyme)